MLLWLLNHASVVRSFNYTIHCTPWLIYFLITNIEVWYFSQSLWIQGVGHGYCAMNTYLRERWQIPKMDIKTPPWKPSSHSLVEGHTTKIRRHRSPTFPRPRWITAVATSSSAVSPIRDRQALIYGSSRYELALDGAYTRMHYVQSWSLDVPPAWTSSVHQISWLRLYRSYLTTRPCAPAA